MLTTNVIRRTFLVRFGESVGTAFALDWNSRQYLVTARHVIDGISAGDEISLLHERQWKTLAVDVVGTRTDEVDVAVLTCAIRLAPPFPMGAGTAGLLFGQRVYFLGFPFGWDSGGDDINHEFPIPFVKAGIVSALSFGPTSRLYIDAHGNEGFSGGPVVFLPDDARGGEYRVAGVVAHYPTPLLKPVLDEEGEPVVDAQGEPVAYFNENPGIVVAYDIRHAIDLMDSNPIGLELSGES